MASTSRRSFDLDPLRHPLWWIALLALLVNDNLLKGRGVAPTWFTGKLSDFAFLVVAPVLLAVLLPVSLRGRRGFATAAIVLVYVVTDLSPAASSAVERIAAWIGLRWRLWPDVTDLVALVVLPLTWRLLRARPTSTRAPTVRASGNPLVGRTGVALGAFACLATPATDIDTVQPFLVNQASGPQQITLSWLLRKTDCNADLAALAAALTVGDLDRPREITLASGEVTGLDSPTAVGARPTPKCSNDFETNAACLGVLVKHPSGKAVLAVAKSSHRDEFQERSFFSCEEEPTYQSDRCQPRLPVNQDPGPWALSLKQEAGEVKFAAGASIRILEVSAAAIEGRPAPAASCGALLEQQRALVASASSCTTDADCQEAWAIPVVAGDCFIYTNRTASIPAIEALHQKWFDACVADARFKNTYGQMRCWPQGARCVEGTCRRGEAPGSPKDASGETPLDQGPSDTEVDGPRGDPGDGAPEADPAEVNQD